MSQTYKDMTNLINKESNTKVIAVKVLKRFRTRSIYDKRQPYENVEKSESIMET